MRRTLTATLLSILPLTALALDYTPATDQFTDRTRMSVAEKAAISVLVNEGVVQGNPDGSFAASRTLNRAEFMKIALGLPGGSVSVGSVGENCFPDVKAGQWFSPYVCAAELAGAIEGYPDGFFHPEREVNYAEAVKILVELFEYPLDRKDTDEWFDPYVRAAADHEVLIPDNIAIGDMITRGEMARLAAAFAAEFEGELELYRRAENGESITASSSSVSSQDSASSVSSASIATSSSSSSISSASSSVPLFFPATPRILTVGSKTPLLYNGVVFSEGEDALVQIVEVQLEREVRSIESLIMVDKTGREIGALALRTYNNDDDKIWYGSVESAEYVIKANQETEIGFIAKLSEYGDDGVSGEIAEVREVSLWTRGVFSSNTHEIVPSQINRPRHQTAYARIKGVWNNGADIGTLQAGSKRKIAEWDITAESDAEVAAMLEGMEFLIETTGINLSNIKIGGETEVVQADCAVDGGITSRISCPVIPSSVKQLTGGSGSIALYANVNLAGGGNGSLQVKFIGKGSLSENGAIIWNDSTTDFRWVDSATVLENGTMWNVTP